MTKLRFITRSRTAVEWMAVLVAGAVVGAIALHTLRPADYYEAAQRYRNSSVMWHELSDECTERYVDRTVESMFLRSDIDELKKSCRTHQESIEDWADDLMRSLEKPKLKPGEAEL